MAINTIKATILMRRGLERDFDVDQMTVGEWSVSTDTKYVRICIAPGIAVRMATYESFEQDMEEIQNILATCQDIQEAVDTMAAIVEQHKNSAVASSADAASSADLAGEKATAAANSAIEAQNSETNAALSEATASSKAAAAVNSASAAKTSETNAASSKTAAANSATDANNSKTAAAQSASGAAGSAATATQKAEEASEYSGLSKSYAVGTDGQVREGDNTDCSKHYYEQAKLISESFAGALRPMGTVAFANLPAVASATEGDMYNVSDQFVTTSDFKEGEGNVIAAGSNVYKTFDGYWDILAGTPVTGIKGDKENSFRRGNVNLTPDDIGALPIETPYAGSFTAGGAASALHLSRQAVDYVMSYDINEVTCEEIPPGHPDNPMSAWCHIYTAQGPDANYASQFAVGMTSRSFYIRNKQAGKWSGWLKLATSDDLNALKTSFQDGCSKIATAITDNGVATAENASPDVMAANIGKIRTPVRGVYTCNASNVNFDSTGFAVRIPAGYYPERSGIQSGYTYNYIAKSVLGDAIAANVLSGKTFTSQNGLKITGTMVKDFSLYEKCFRYVYENKASDFYFSKEVWCVKAGASITISWNYIVNNTGGAWYHSTEQDWNGGVDPGCITYSYDNAAKTYTVTGVKEGISIIRLRSASNHYARCIIIVEKV